MNLLSRLRGQRPPTSREIAKQRLQLVLVHDRSRISPGMLEMLKDEIIAVISKHIEIDEAGVQVTFSQNDRESRLMADIPLADGHRARGQL
ncbi:MAG TPA: cell division topological specificity factor MinE [Anaerolineae bacterium]|nr:cell division topological specificity factor MinE [Anaerolineae bacterium]